MDAVDGTPVDAKRDHTRAFGIGKVRGHFGDLWRKTPVEADLHKARTFVQRSDHVVQLVQIKRQRFLNENRLTGAECGGGQLGMTVMTGSNDDSIDIGVGEHAV